MSWTNGQDMPKCVNRPGIAIVDNHILTIGGYSDNGWIADTCKYNPATNTWEQCQPMPQSVEFHDRSTAAVGSEVFVLADNTFLVYSTTRDQWSQLQPPEKLVQYCAMVPYRKRLLALGGWDERRKDYVQAYDPASKTWKLEDQTIPLPLDHHWAVVVKATESE